MPEFVKTSWQPAEQKDYAAAVQSADEETRRLFARIRELEELDANGDADVESTSSSSSSAAKSKQQPFIPPPTTLGVISASSSSSTTTTTHLDNNNNNNINEAAVPVNIETAPVSSVVVERDPNSKKRVADNVPDGSNSSNNNDDDAPPAAPKRVSKFKAAMAQARK
jgi:hypothetical protein